MQHLTFLKKLSVAPTLGLILSVAFAAFGQTPKTDETRELPPAQTLDRQMTGAETHRYKISLQKDEFLQVRVEQKGVDVALKLLDASGKELATMDSPNGTEGPEILSFVAATAGSYILEVSGFDAKGAKGNYTIRREASRTATTQDKRRVEVEKLFVEGVTALGTGQRESALTKLEGALRGWQELKENYLSEWTAQQVKQLKEGPKGAQAKAKYDEAFALVQQGTKESLQAALPKFAEARRSYSELGDKRMEAFALNELGSIYANLGDKQNALAYFIESLALGKAVGDKNGEGITLNNIGFVYSSLGENQKALEYFNQALLLRKAVGDRKGEADTLNNIGTVYKDLGEKQKALDYYNQGLPLRKAVGDKRGEAYTLHNIGGVYSNLSENQKAVEYYTRALSLIRAVGDTRAEAVILNGIAVAYSDLGENQKALENFALALPLHRVVGNRNSEAVTLNNIGGVYSILGEKQKALEYYNQSLPLMRAVGNKRGEGIILNSIGAVYAELGENQKALEYYNLALALLKAVGDRTGQAATLTGIGVVYSNLGDKQKTLDYYNQALPLRKAVGDRGGEANILNNLGRVYYDFGEKSKSLDYYNQALPLRKAAADRHGEATTLNNMMYVWGWLNNWRLAILYGKQLVNTLQSLRADIKGLDKELQQSFLGTVESSYRKLAELLIKENRIPEAEQVLRMLKEEEYFEFVRRDGRVVASLDERINLNPAEKQAVEQYETISLGISRIYHEIEKLEKEKSTAPAGQAKVISDKQAELNKNLAISSSKLKSFLVELSTDFAKTDADSKGVEESSQAIVKEWNDPQAAVISTIVGGNNLSVIVTTAEFQRGYVIPVSEERLNKLVGDFRAAIVGREDVKPAAQELYNVLVKPLEKDLDAAKARTLVWSLDKFLRYVPVSALWDKDKGYLVQNYASVILALASRQNLAFRPTRKNQWQALGVGVSKKSEGFAPLSYVPEELQAIVRDSSAQPKKREFGIIAGRRLLDEQFTYDSFLKSLGKYPFTHAATHFKFIPGTKAEGLNSFLLMGNGEKLTLAQVQNSDNIFAGIELLTLSACDTGYGGKTADGREIEGFGVLAQRKGARAIMATLWNVDDESTRDLMIGFYGDYQKPNFNKAEALRQAQLALLQEPDKITVGKTTKSVNASPKRFAHPYYWSPFILIGNWQ
jgi:CHAT domain-containing protein/Tfp pilus assembly protein PilF